MLLKRPCLSRALFAVVLSTAVSYTSVAQQQSSSAADFSGVWDRGAPPLGEGAELPFRPWAKEVFDKRNADMAAERPYVDNRMICLPDGAVDAMFTPYLYYFMQTPTRLYILMEFNNQMRTVFLNTAHPADVRPTWYGHSVGHWEGDTLVVETIGFNDRTPLMTLFHGGTTRTNIPHTDALRVIERLTLSDDGMTFTNRMTIDDPGAFTEPWTLDFAYQRRNDDARVGEFVCADDFALLDPDSPLDMEGLITVGPDGELPIDLETLGLAD